MFDFPKRMLRVFKDENLQNNFEKNGYVIVDFYNKDEIIAAEKLYYDIHPEKEGFYPATYSFDKQFRDQMDKGIKSIMSRQIENFFIDIKVVCSSFIVKTPGPNSGMSIHQDMTLIDESKYTGINIWIPLVDLTIKNGALFVIPGSHRIFPTYRGSSIREFFSDVMDEMYDYLHPVLIKAGQAVIFDQSIIHFSPPNYSDKIRIVTNTYICHKDTEFRTFFWDNTTPEEYVEGFIQDDNFMLDYEQFGSDIRQRPRVGKSMGLIPYNFPRIDSKFLEKTFEKTNARKLINDAIPKQYLVISEGNVPEQLSVKIKKTSIFDRIKAILK